MALEGLDDLVGACFGIEPDPFKAAGLIDERIKIKCKGLGLEVLPMDNKAAYHFGQIRAELYRMGQPIGPYDMMIAGHARASGLILVTNNVKEFARVPGFALRTGTLWSDSKKM